jgi:hypothetical protein
MKKILTLGVFILATTVLKAQEIRMNGQHSEENENILHNPELWRWIKMQNGDDSHYYRLMVNQSVLQKIWENEPDSIRISVPEKSGKVRNLKFEKVLITDASFHVETSDGRKLSGKEFSGVHYRISGEADCKVGGLSFREGGLMGFIGLSNSNISIGEKEPGSGKFFLSYDEDQKQPSWNCDTDDTGRMDVNPQIPRSTSINKAVTTICKPVSIYFESDLDLYSKSGNSLTTASNFVTGLFNIVAQIYNNEGITIRIGSIFQWTSSDPYVGMTSSYTVLNQFGTSRPVGSVNADLMHLISTRSASMGGLAYVGVLCSPLARHAFSNIFYQYSALPTFSWSVHCISHELGHNFGSKHTHWCGWTLPNGTTGRIDSCYAGEGTCGTVTKYRVGTVMSYCYLTSGVNFNLGFGTLPGAAIRNGLNAATCITGSTCMATPTVTADSLSNKNNSFVLSLSVPANHNATSWILYEGSTSIRTGTLTGISAFNTTVSITGKANGTYTYKMVLSNGTSTSTSSTLTVSVAVSQTPQTPVTSNICTASGLQAYFGTDGKMRFKFGISSPCTTYTVQVCRYNLTDPNVVPAAGATPVACGIRNGMSAYSPVSSEWTQGFIERIADPQPSNRTTAGMGNFWYSVDVTCNSGGTCTTTNRTRTYVFVPGI